MGHAHPWLCDHFRRCCGEKRVTLDRGPNEGSLQTKTLIFTEGNYWEIGWGWGLLVHGFVEEVCQGLTGWGWANFGEFWVGFFEFLNHEVAHLVGDLVSGEGYSH